MTGFAPHARNRKALAKIARIEAAMARGAPLETFVGLIGGKHLRVCWGAGGVYFTFEPDAAREMAASFETDESVAADLAWVAGNLREAADLVDAQLATLQ